MKTAKLIYINLFLLLICGCSSTALKHDFTSYSEVYSEANDAQLLLNLARLSQHEPLNFLQLGTISSQYQMTTSVGFNPSATRTDPVLSSAASAVQHALTFGGSLNAGLVQTPTFQFVPITGTNLMQALFTPISDRVFYTFYDQYYPADLLARIMIESIQIGKRTFFTNDNRSITVQTNYYYLVNSPSSSTYPAFLEFCDYLKNAQSHEQLNVGIISNNSTVFIDYSNSVKLPDVTSAIQAGFLIGYNEKQLITATKPSFVIGFLPSNNTNNLRRDNASLAQNSNGQMNFLFYDSSSTAISNINNLQLDSILKHLRGPNSEFTSGISNLFSAKTFAYDTQFPSNKIESALAFAKVYADTNFMITFKMRTFESALFNVAQQQAEFKERRNYKIQNLVSVFDNKKQLAEALRSSTNFAFLTNDINYLEDELGPYAEIKRSELESPTYFRVRPVMTLNFDKPPAGFSELVEIKHHNIVYHVGDVKNDGTSDGSRNKTAFTILTYLFSQTAIGTQNLPVQQLIQVQ